jgi:hypothetical protein
MHATQEISARIEAHIAADRNMRGRVTLHDGIELRFVVASCDQFGDKVGGRFAGIDCQTGKARVFWAWEVRTIGGDS